MASQSSQLRRSASRARGNALTALPLEILVKIITEVPTKNFLDLVQTCRSIRNFMKLNASQICNHIIRSRFAIESALLQAKMDAGWLVPTLELLRAEEKAAYRAILRDEPDTYWIGNARRAISILGESKQGEQVPVSLMSPGPQFLHLLEKGLLVVLPAEVFQDCTNVFLEQAHLEKAVLHGRSYIIGCSNLGEKQSNTLYDGYSFVMSINRRYAYMENRRLVPPLGHSGPHFARELIWFYGAERLKIEDCAGGRQGRLEDIADTSLGVE